MSKPDFTCNLFAEITVYADSVPFLTPPRISLLESIERHGSIVQAAQSVPISYCCAWRWVQEMNRIIGFKLVVSDRTQGSRLTARGRFVVDMYHSIQNSCGYGIAYMNHTINDGRES